MALSAFGHRVPLLRRGCCWPPAAGLQQSIVISCPPGPQRQTCCTGHTSQTSEIYARASTVYGAETWSVTQTLQKRLDSFEQRCLRRILRVSFRDRCSNAEVRQATGNPPSLDVRARRLRLFGHIVRAETSTNYAHALHSLTHGPLKDWKRPAGRPRTTWLRTVEEQTSSLQ